MTMLSTDDAARDNEYPYMGPVSTPFPWTARVSATLLGAGLIFASWIVLGFFTPTFLFQTVPYVPPAFAKSVFVATTGVFLGFSGAVYIGPKLTKKTPLRYWVRTFISELEAPKMPHEPALVEFVQIPNDFWGHQKHRVAHRVTLDHLY